MEWIQAIDQDYAEKKRGVNNTVLTEYYETMQKSSLMLQSVPFEAAKMHRKNEIRKRAYAARRAS